LVQSELFEDVRREVEPNNYEEHQSGKGEKGDSLGSVSFVVVFLPFLMLCGR
jgi:hypothetical protein